MLVACAVGGQSQPRSKRTVDYSPDWPGTVFARRASGLVTGAKGDNHGEQPSSLSLTLCCSSGCRARLGLLYYCSLVGTFCFNLLPGFFWQFLFDLWGQIFVLLYRLPYLSRFLWLFFLYFSLLWFYWLLYHGPFFYHFSCHFFLRFLCIAHYGDSCEDERAANKSATLLVSYFAFLLAVGQTAGH